MLAEGEIEQKNMSGQRSMVWFNLRLLQTQKAPRFRQLKNKNQKWMKTVQTQQDSRKNDGGNHEVKKIEGKKVGKKQKKT